MSEELRLRVFFNWFFNLCSLLQTQVDEGVPVGTCLMLFGRWLQEMREKKGFKFPCDQMLNKDENKPTENLTKWCTFVTWSGIWLNFLRSIHSSSISIFSSWRAISLCMLWNNWLLVHQGFQWSPTTDETRRLLCLEESATFFPLIGSWK